MLFTTHFTATNDLDNETYVAQFIGDDTVTVHHLGDSIELSTLTMYQADQLLLSLLDHPNYTCEVH